MTRFLSATGAFLLFVAGCGSDEDGGGGGQAGSAGTGGLGPGGSGPGGTGPGGSGPGGTGPGGSGPGGSGPGGTGPGGAGPGGAAGAGNGGMGGMGGAAGSSGSGGVGGGQSTVCQAGIPSPGGGGGGNACLGAPPALKLTEVISGVSRPMFMTSAPGDASMLYVAEKAGRIRVWNGNTLGTFLDIAGGVSGGGERGLLGFAFHPRFGQGGEMRFWVKYNRNDRDTVVAEFTALSMTSADAGSEQQLFVVGQPAGNHNGGMIAFGPKDGCLYVGMGDGGGSDDQYDNGQNFGTRLGSMLRVDVDLYPTPPPGNYPGGHADNYHVGVRNPWRWSFDRATGDMYIGDVGQNLWEEISVAPANAGNLNFGWPIMEASTCFRAASCNMSGLTLPLVDVANSTDGSIAGGYVYRGAAIPGLVGRYIYGGYYSESIWTVTWDGTAACDQHDITADLDPLGDIDGLAGFGEDANGELYVVSDLTGQVFRIDPE